jgi:hypothetical protein
MFNIAGNSSGGYNLTNSLRIRSSASAYLSRTFSTTQTDSRKITVSFWLKLGSAIGSATNQTILTGYNGTSAGASGIGIASDKLTWGFGNNSAGNDAALTTTQVFRDPSAWYHIVCVGDSTQATAGNRMSIYINGVQVTAFTTNNAPNLNLATQIGVNTANNRIGTRWNTGSEYFDGYLSEMNVIDGQALTPSSFGSTDATTGQWLPKKYTGTYGTNGFYLNFNSIALTSGSNTGLGKDNSGNANYWNTNNISVTAGTTYDAMTDVPTLTNPTVANYAVMNPLAWRTAYSNTVPTNGNLTCTGADNFHYFTSTMQSSGSYYFEMTASTVAGSGAYIAIWQNENPQSAAATACDYYSSTGVVTVLGSTVFTGATYTSGNVIGFAHNVSAGTVAIYKNNVLQGTATGLPTTSSLYPGCLTGTGTIINANFGQRPFTYTPPTGFVALNTFNLPTSTIVKGNTVMDATLYTGTGASLSVTNAGSFKPDLVWIKSRSGAFSHNINDSNRGVLKQLQSDNTSAESNINGAVSAYNTNGFSVTNGSSGIAEVSNSGSTYVAWQWQAGQGSNVSNTSGSITSTVSVNASAGFSIATYTNASSGTATVGHGLGVAPAMIITKQRGSTGNWRVYHKSLAAGYYVLLNSTAAQSNTLNIFTTTLPTSTVFSLGTTVAGEGTAVAYCWAEIAGFSKFGSYTGNGSADGTFIYTGFRPKFIMAKRTDTTSNWLIYDTSRDTYNVASNYLLPDSSGAEGSAVNFDLLSNGFKCKSATGVNVSGGTYIYMAFAENPFKYSNAR